MPAFARLAIRKINSLCPISVLWKYIPCGIDYSSMGGEKKSTFHLSVLCNQIKDTRQAWEAWWLYNFTTATTLRRNRVLDVDSTCLNWGNWWRTFMISRSILYWIQLFVTISTCYDLYFTKYCMYIGYHLAGSGGCAASSSGDIYSVVQCIKWCPEIIIWNG
jgi:hypothetical protein